MRYIKIPKEIVYCNWLTDRRVMVYAYLCVKRSCDDTVGFSINDMVRWSGLVPDSHKGKINQKYYTILSRLNEMGYFEECPDFQKISKEQAGSDKFRSLKVCAEKFGSEREYGYLGLDEIAKIISYKDFLREEQLALYKTSPYHLLLVLSYIRVNIIHSREYPRCFWRYLKTIGTEIDVPPRRVSDTVSVLEALGLIKTRTLPVTAPMLDEDGNSEQYSAPTLFADTMRYKKNGESMALDETYDCEKELDDGKAAYLERVNKNKKITL